MQFQYNHCNSFHSNKISTRYVTINLIHYYNDNYVLECNLQLYVAFLNNIHCITKTFPLHIHLIKFQICLSKKRRKERRKFHVHE